MFFCAIKLIVLGLQPTEYTDLLQSKNCNCVCNFSTKCKTLDVYLIQSLITSLVREKAGTDVTAELSSRIHRTVAPPPANNVNTEINTVVIRPSNYDEDADEHGSESSA